MSDPAATARMKIAALELEIARLKDFLALYEELSGSGKKIAAQEPGFVSREVEGNVAHQVIPSAHVDNSARRHHRQRAEMRPHQTAELMERIIRETGHPMTRGEIVEAFERRDVQIPFEDKARYIGTIAWRHKGMFENIEGRGYWLRGEPVPPPPSGSDLLD